MKPFLFAIALMGAAVDAQAPVSSSLDIRVGFERPGGGYTVQTIPLETYISRVLAGEAARDSPPAALETLAITIRTYALANRGRHRADGFDMCDQTHCQVVRTATPATDRAVQATAGLALLRDGVPASVYYSASCGGRTEIPSEVWPGTEDPSYLPTQDDDACGGAPAWTADLTDADLYRSLRAAGFRGDRLRDVRIAARNRSGRVSRLKLDGLLPDEISGQDLRMAVGRTIGWQYLKSAAFDLDRRGSTFQFSGHGYGHGVGLCVIGSVNLAAAGKSAAEILAKYFPGLAIMPVDGRVTASLAAPRAGAPVTARVAPGPDLAVDLPDEDEGNRGAIAKVAMKARDEIAATLGLAAPVPLTIRFHRTTDEYERATGQSWYMSGAVVKGELHLLPLAVLRQRDVLEETIRHQLVHLMVDGALASRPAWVREGAAIYFAGDPPVPGGPQRPPFRPEPRASCPTDNELLRPISVGALTNAYARARECFAKQIGSGKSWRDIK